MIFPKVVVLERRGVRERTRERGNCLSSLPRATLGFTFQDFLLSFHPSRIFQALFVSLLRLHFLFCLKSVSIMDNGKTESLRDSLFQQMFLFFRICIVILETIENLEKRNMGMKERGRGKKRDQEKWS